VDHDVQGVLKVLLIQEQILRLILPIKKLSIICTLLQSKVFVFEGKNIDQIDVFRDVFHDVFRGDELSQDGLKQGQFKALQELQARCDVYDVFRANEVKLK